MMRELLVEIGVEEIPAGYIQPALEALAARAAVKLDALGLEHTPPRIYGSPRRLTLALDGLQSQQPDRRQQHLGPSKAAGLSADGSFSKAAIGFARSRRVAPGALQLVRTDKGEYFMAVEEMKGEPVERLLPGLLESLIRELPFPKSMRWASTSLSFARPLQWLLALYGGKVIPVEIEGIMSGGLTRGHRFLAPEAFSISHLQSYLNGLAERFVLVDAHERRERVVEEVERAVREHSGKDGAKPVLDEGLLDIVTNLVEYPVALCGAFDPKFLQLPKEALITSMREHQKYFPVLGADGKLLPLFVAVNNTIIEDQALAVNGHERVLRARLEDGLFFFNEDRKAPLAQRVAGLEGIIFHHKLGDMGQKSKRIAQLAATLATQLAPELADDARIAAQLAKADLLTSMVSEFPSLQGVMGRVYALHDGEQAAIAQAIEEHYLPLRAGGQTPSSLLGALVGIADRMDTLAGCFAIGEKPTGAKDAFGLRRQAIGLINVIRSQGLSLSLRSLAQAALQGYGDSIQPAAGAVEELLHFIRLRFENEQIAHGLPQEVVEAVTTVGCDDLVDAIKRIEALQTLRGEEGLRLLAGSFKRIRNIVKDNETTQVNPALLQQEAEQSLHAVLNQVESTIHPFLQEQRYSEAMLAMLAMKEPVDRFFSEVMVMAEDALIRQNRLNLLSALAATILRIADISKMHVEKEEGR